MKANVNNEQHRHGTRLVREIKTMLEYFAGYRQGRSTKNKMYENFMSKVREWTDHTQRLSKIMPVTEYRSHLQTLKKIS